MFGTVIMYHVFMMHVKYHLALSNLSNFGSIFLCVCCNVSEKNGLILFIFGTVINHKKDLMHIRYTLALCHNVAFMSII